MEKIEMNIEGMHCGACAIGIQMVADGIDGVQSSSVDYDDKKGVFEFDPEKTSKDAIVEEIKKLGYTAS